MELGKYQGVLRNLKRTKGGLRTVVYDPSIEDTTVDFPDIEQPKMGFEDGGRVNFSKGGTEGVDFSRTQTKKFKYPFTGRYGTIYYPNPIERKTQQTPQVIKKYKAIKNFFDKAIETENYNYLVSSTRGKGKLPNQYANEINKLKFGTDEFNKFAERIGLDKNTLKDVLNQRQNFIAGRKTEATRQGILGKVKNQKTIMEVLEKGPVDLKTLSKKTKLTQEQTKEELRKLLRNIYAQRVQIGKGKYAVKGDWSIFLPTDENKLDNLLQNFWNTKGIPKIKKDTIGDLFYRAYGKQFLPDGKTLNPTYNPKRYKNVLGKLKEYNVIREFVENNFDIKLDLDHPLDRSALTSINATPDQMVRVTPVSRSINRGLKEKLQKKINSVDSQLKTAKGDQLLKLQNQKKGLDNLVNYLEIETGKISPSGKIVRYGVDPFETLDLKKEIVENLSFQNELASKIKDPKFKELTKQAGIENYKFNVSNIDPKVINQIKKIKPQDAVNVISSVACPNQYSDGGPVKFSNKSKCFLRGAEIINDAKAGNPSALQKVRKYLKTPAARFGLGALAELGIEGLFAVEGIAEGKPFDQVLGESILGIVGVGSTEEEQILKYADPEDIEDVKAYQKKLANENKLSANVGFEKTVQPETGEESTEDFFTVESLRPAIDKQRKQLQKDFNDPNLEKEEEAYGRAYRNYREVMEKNKEEQGYRRPFQYIQREIYDPTGKAIMKAYEGIQNLFADGGRVGMSEGGDPKDKMKTPFDKPTLPIDPNQIPQVENPSRRGFIKGAGFIGAGIAAFAAGLLRLGRKESAKKLVQKAATYGGRRIDGVPEIISDLIQTIKLKGQVVDAPKPGSGPVVYKYNKYEYAEDVNGFTINKVNDRGDYGYSEEVFQFEKDPETGAIFFDDVTVKPDGDGKLKDVEYGVDTETYDEIADDLAKFNHIHPNDTRFRDKAKKWVDEERLKNEGIEPKPGTELD